jgi:hypothetical protein
MKVQIREGIVLAYGKALEGDDVYQAPDDYCPEKYTYTPIDIDVFNPNGFIINFDNLEN